MPLGGNVRFRVKQTAKGPVRLAFRDGEVVEAKNLKTGAVHSPGEFERERRRSNARGARRALSKNGRK